jgi:hypothetical protein
MNMTNEKLLEIFKNSRNLNHLDQFGNLPRQFDDVLVISSNTAEAIGDEYVLCKYNGCFHVVKNCLEVYGWHDVTSFGMDDQAAIEFYAECCDYERELHED